MKILFTERSIIWLMLLLAMVACQPKEDIQKGSDLPNENASGYSGDMLVLGKQKENPYSVENMRKAYANLQSNGRVADFDILTTDLYVRFLPADSAELESLLSDTTLIFWDYPLDFEVAYIGHYYHDPSIPDSLPTYQYTVVKPDFQFPAIQYEIMAELFLPEDYDIDESAGRMSQQLLDELEYEARRITGNLEEDETEPSASGRTAADKWNPSGRVTVREVTSTGAADTIPVKNVKVKAKNWFHLASAYTDANGYYKIERFKHAVDYKIEFENYLAKVTNLLGWSRNHNGPNESRKAWNPFFNWDDANGVGWSESWANATVLNAAFEAKVQVNKYGLQTPFPTTFWAGSGRAFNKINIRTIFESGRSKMHDPGINEIKLYTKTEDDGIQRMTDELYRVSFHELAHSMHDQLPGLKFSGTNPILKESWAMYIQYVFTNNYYAHYATSCQARDWEYHIWDETGGEDEDNEDNWKYTALFIDLVDTKIQSAPPFRMPIDSVSGYSITQLQTALRYSKELQELRDYLKNNYSNTTKKHLDKLFEFYIDVEKTRKR